MDLKISTLFYFVPSKPEESILGPVFTHFLLNKEVTRLPCLKENYQLRKVVSSSGPQRLRWELAFVCISMLFLFRFCTRRV